MLQNLDQDFFVDLYAGNDSRYEKIRRNIKIRKKQQSKEYIGAANVNACRERLVGNNILGGDQHEAEEYIRHWHSEAYNKDTAIIWRFALENNCSNGFFLSNGDIEFDMNAPEKTHIGK